MTIQRVTPPPRSRLWTTEDADQAYALLTAEDNGDQAVEYGRYEKGKEQMARTQGMALNQVIASRHNGARFGITVFEDGGEVVGALLPRAPKENTNKNGSGSGSAKKKSAS